MDQQQIDAIRFALKYEVDVRRLRKIGKGLLLEVITLRKELDDGTTTEASEAHGSRDALPVHPRLHSPE
jgi:hypothetical protein